MQAVERVFAILRALAAHGGNGSVGTVAVDTGLPKSTVSRILAALETEGAVERVGDGVYAIGWGLLALTGELDETTLLTRVAEPYLLDLAAEFGEGAGLSVEHGDESLYALHVGSRGAVRTEDWTGESFPYHTVAGGLAILATWPDERIDAYADGGLAALSSKTLTTRRALRRRIRTIRAAGYASTIGEFDVDINGVGAAIVGPDGASLGAITVYGPAYRFPGTRSVGEVGMRCIEVAAQVAGQFDRR